jgi:hypothetical protein
MVYTKTVWAEIGMDEPSKLAALQKLETQYDESIAAVLAHRHDSIYFTKSEADAKFFGPSTDGVGSGANAGTLDSHTADDISSSSISSGTIVMYVGAGYTLPTGWEEYTDANGKFPVGAGATYAVKSLGGSQMTEVPVNPHGFLGGHNMTISEMPVHTHTFTQFYNPDVNNRKLDPPGMACYRNGSVLTHTGYAYDAKGGTASGYSHSHACTVTVNSVDHTPPYMVLKFIKKS